MGHLCGVCKVMVVFETVDGMAGTHDWRRRLDGHEWLAWWALQ